ncbi:rubrerythrin family protein [Candidatus Saccharibacteria bacterium]|nr:rubrerythrin family protein [Candidatus Saccharibacteria bacterium]
MELKKNTKTWKNLETAFAGESQAFTKYNYFASQAKKDGFEQISEIFLETAGNEKEHAKMWYKLLHDGKVGSTKDNLTAAAQGENYEWSDMYKTFADEAREEGYEDIAKMFEGVGAVEKEHETRYLKLRDNIEHDVVFKSDKVTIWKCRNCGHIYTGTQAPEVCPVCSHPRAYFEIKANNY